MASNNLDAGEGYFFERLNVEHSMLKSLLSGLRITRSNFSQVGQAYESITQMEKKCREQLDKLNKTPESDSVVKLASVNLCEDMLHAADREVAIVKTVMSRAESLIGEAKGSLSRFEVSHANLTSFEASAEDGRIVEILGEMNETASQLQTELSSLRETYEDFMGKWSERVNVRSQLFDDISVARKQLGEV